MTLEPTWSPDPQARRWGWGDALALSVWTMALVAFFWDAVTLRKALFYFDITEINYPYRDFFASELRAGRISRWCPGLYNGLPLYAESQAGYWHPLKYVFYPWMSTWKAFNLDTIASVWLTGLATYGWFRRHVGASGALTGASLFGLSGFVWAHLIHTSMTNALISVPLVFWALEASWDGGKIRGAALGALALASQVFAGHLQDTILTGGAIGIYAIYRAMTAIGWRSRVSILLFAATLGGLGVAVSSVQWVPSKNLLDRSPREGGLTWEQVTYGSWSPELLPTLVVREAYGTLPRDTDWQDGYYPYHEMNAYMGLAGLALAVVGAGAWRDRWVAFWVILASLGGLFMLGRYTALFDYMNKVPVVGSSRIPVRYHLWVSLAIAALGAVGVDRLSRPGKVRLGTALTAMAVVIVCSIGLMVYEYIPAWSEARRWSTAGHQLHFRWLGQELTVALVRTTVLSVLAWMFATLGSKEDRPGRRGWLAAMLPLVVIADLLGSHLRDVATIDPSYWTKPPESATKILAEPSTIRIFGAAERSAAEPGYASKDVNFFEVRDTLAWSLPPIWGIRSATGNTPIYPRRMLTYHEHANPPLVRFEVEGVTQILSGRAIPGFPGKTERSGLSFIHSTTNAQPRARLMGRPVYVLDEQGASKALDTLGPAIRDRVIVEDPDRPLDPSAKAEGLARIEVDEAERVEVVVDARGSAYLVLADTYDPGWSASMDGRPVPIRPAFAAFRAVYLPKGEHRVVFTYEPAGFRAGLIATGLGFVLVLVALAWPKAVASADPSHGPLRWPRSWPIVFGTVLVLFIVVSAFQVRPNGLAIHPRWKGSFHRFSWAAGIEAIEPMREAIGR